MFECLVLSEENCLGSIRRCSLVEAGVTLLEQVCKLGDDFGFQKVHTRWSLTDSVCNL